MAKEYWSDLDPTVKFETYQEAEEHEAKLVALGKGGAGSSPQQAGAAAFRSAGTADRPDMMAAGDTQGAAGTPYRGGALPSMDEFRIKYGGTETGKRVIGEEEKRVAAEQEAQQSETIRKGVSQYADLYEETDPEFANFVRMGVNTGILKDKKDIIDVFAKYTESQRGKKESALEREAGQARAETMAGAGITRAKIGAEGKEDKGTFTQENQLRSQFNNISKNFTTIRDSYTRVKSSSQNPSAAGDLSMVFNYMKMLDPNSVVRESEYASAENARGIPESIRNMYNKAVDGEILSAKQRADFLNRANELYSTSENIQKKLKDQYGAIAASYGIDGDRVTGGVVIGSESGEETDIEEKPAGMNDAKWSRLQELRRKQAEGTLK